VADFTAAGMTLAPRRSTIDAAFFDAQMTTNCNMKLIPPKTEILAYDSIVAVEKAMPLAGFGAGVYEAVDDAAEDANDFPEMYYASMILNSFMSNPMVDCDFNTLSGTADEEEVEGDLEEYEDSEEEEEEENLMGD
jgi:hypothetical protein